MGKHRAEMEFRVSGAGPKTSRALQRVSMDHTPSDIIVDASMPAMIRNGGKMWGADGRLKDTKAVMPESTFAASTRR